MIYFRKIGIYVPLRVLPFYLFWLLQVAVRERTIRDFVRGVWSPTLFFRAPHNIDDALSVARDLGLSNGWVRWETDGSRRQVFDSSMRGVCKIQKEGAAFSVNDEVELRKKLGDLSPRILKSDASHMAYVEDWVNVSAPRTYSYDDLECIRLALVDQLYRIDEWDLVSFLNKSAVPFSREARDVIPGLVRRMELKSLPVSKVHGDLVQANISFTKEGRPILYDWEYSRSCVVTHDVWFFLYQGLLGDGVRLELSDFMREFEKIIDWIFPESVEPLALHLIHLYEREALLLWNNKIVESSQALKKIGENIREARSLLSDECGVLGNINSEARIER